MSLPTFRPTRVPGSARARTASDTFRDSSAAVFLLWFWLCDPGSAADVPLKDQPHLRRPIAAAWLQPNQLLAIANQRSGSISIVDISNRQVLDEVVVGQRLADVAALPSGGWFLAVDDRRHELLVLRWALGKVDGAKLEVAERIKVSQYPVSVAVSPDGSRCTVASLWSRTVATFAVQPATETEPPTLNKLNELVLSFAPGELIYLPDGEHVLVADAFTGQMALIDVPAQKVVEIRANYVFRIYGMALSTDPDALYVAHQAAFRTLPAPKWASGAVGNGAARNNDKANDGRANDDPAKSSQGKQLVNFVGEYSIAGLLEGRLQRYVGNREEPARSGYFEGDLRQMAELAPGLVNVTTERRRQALATAAGQQRVLVRRFSDDLIVSDAGKPTRETTIKLGPVGALTAADRGEALFYDTSLSATGWMSCHACHPDGHTTGQLVDTLGDDSKGTHKRVLTLLGSAATGRWAWSGDVPLKMQVFKSLKTTMGKQSTPQITSDLTAFLQTLPPPPPLKPASDDPDDDDPADRAQLSRGEALFGRLGCVDCHVPAQGYTSDATYDVGLRDEKGMTKFNPPSLRGVSQGYSYFHDGRAKKLEEVLITHRHPHGEVLPDDEVADLVRFLSSL